MVVSHFDVRAPALEGGRSVTVRRAMTDLQREWRLAAADRVVPLTFAIVGTLTLLAVMTGWLRTEQRIAYQEALRRENSIQRHFLESAFYENGSSESTTIELSPTQEDRLGELQMSAKSPDLMRYIEGIWRSIYPASPLSGLSRGASGEWPDHYHHRGPSTTQTLARTVRSNPLLATIGTFDATLLVGAILPLAVVALTYNVVSSDREQGRWSLVEIHATSAPRLIATRCIVRVVGLVTTVATVLTACVLIAKTADWDLTVTRNLSVWIGWLIAYLAFWTALTISVNSFSVSSSGAGLLLLLCWFIFAIVIPSVIELGINRRFQFPRQAELIALEQEIQKQTEEESEKVWADFLRRHTEVQFDSNNPQQEFLLRDIAINKVVRLKVAERLEKHYQRYLDRESVLDRSQLLSPLLAWRTASDQCAGTSVRHYVGFAKQTSKFHGSFITYFEPFSISGRELSQSDIQEIPKFDAHKLQTQIHTPSLLWSAASLLLWTTVAGLVSWWNFRRRAFK